MATRVLRTSQHNTLKSAPTNTSRSSLDIHSHKRQIALRETSRSNMAYQVDAWPVLISYIRELREKDNSCVFPGCIAQVKRLTEVGWMAIDSEATVMTEVVRENLLAFALACMQAALNPLVQLGDCS